MYVVCLISETIAVAELISSVVSQLWSPSIIVAYKDWREVGKRDDGNGKDNPPLEADMKTWREKRVREEVP